MKYCVAAYILPSRQCQTPGYVLLMLNIFSSRGDIMDYVGSGE